MITKNSFVLPLICALTLSLILPTVNAPYSGIGESEFGYPTVAFGLIEVVPTQPVFETDSLNEFGLVAQLHKLQVGQAQDGELEISWNSPDDLTITQISTEEFTDWFGFRRAPFILEDGDAVSTGVIQYVVRAPVVYCDASKGITLNCAQPIVYTIPITITGNVNGETFTTTTSVKVDLSNNIEPATFMIFIAFAGGVGGIAYHTYTTNKSKSSKSNTGKRKTGGKKGSFLDNLSDLG